mmetsp:Transcript_30735/g.27946  ORF Transcript_30735/g.27946 Transcript_30735/m.27946 type:complete len:98 (-) Transcript_30735:917-1210(-)
MLSNGIDESEIEFLLDSFKLRLGAIGKERHKILQYMFQQQIDMLLPTHVKYILKVAEDAKDMFSDMETTFINRIPSTILSQSGFQDQITELWPDLVQ